MLQPVTALLVMSWVGGLQAAVVASAPFLCTPLSLPTLYLILQHTIVAGQREKSAGCCVYGLFLTAWAMLWKRAVLLPGAAYAIVIFVFNIF